MSLPYAPGRLSMNDLVKYIGISQPIIYEKLNPKKPGFDNDFPRPVKAGKKNLFLTKEIDTWIEKDAAKNRS